MKDQRTSKRKTPNTYITGTYALSFFGLTGLTSSLLVSSLLANPSGGNVAAGDATISSAGNTLTIDQLSDRAIINWQDFSIGNGEVTQFNQLSSSSAVLNRVVGNNLSTIHGSLQANGQVYLLNQNGILVGDTGVIQTGGFIASTHQLVDADFLAGGNLTFAPGTEGGAIVNLGQISVTGGDVFLIADQVRNEGNITATDGTVGLAAAAGAEVILADSGEQRLLVQPSTEVTGGEGVVNQGSINGVNAELKAAGGNVYALAINNDGAIRATDVHKVGGRILLTSKGGKIKLGSNSRLNASGENGGGTINVGGSKLGNGPIDNAAEVTIEEGSEIAADATVNGDGGEIIVFAEDTAILAGRMSATGGSEGGNGGFIETSGKRSWSYDGWAQNVDLSAPLGRGGEFLIDPNDITISSAGSGTAGSNNLNNTDIVNFLNGGSSLTISTDIAAGGGNGDITINDAILYDSTADFTLLASRDLNFNASVQNSNAGDLNLVAGWDGVTAFDVASFDIADVTTTDIFGAGNGSINVGAGSQTFRIAVGSRSGNTRAYGYDLNIIAAESSAQLGFRSSQTGGASSNATGDITARVKHDITAAGGDNVITAYSQLGHGGIDTGGEHSGAITISSGNNLTFTGGDSIGTYSQLGHRGDGNHSGAITISSANDLIFTGGDFLSYSQLGHEGDGNHSGAITISNANDLIFIAGNASQSYSQLGHGSADFGSNSQTTGTREGDIFINALGEISTQDGFSPDSNSNFGWIGHGSATVDAISNADVTIFANAWDTTSTLTVASGGVSNLNSSLSAMLLNNLGGGDVVVGLRDSSLQISSALQYDEVNNLTLLSTDNLNFNASVQNENDTSGDINLVAGWDGVTLFDAATFDAADVSTTGLFGSGNGNINVGGGSQTTGIAVGSRSGNTRAYGYDLNITGGAADDSFAQLGFRAPTTAVALNATGAITARVSNDITATGGGIQSYSQLGHGGRAADGNHSGAITVSSANDLIFMGGSERAYSQLGHGGLAADGNHSGSIIITEANDLSFTAGGNVAASRAFSQLGHGGLAADGNHSGSIIITEANDLNFTGSGLESYSQLGHGGGFVAGDHSGAITIAEANDLIFSGGIFSSSYAQLGHGGDGSGGNYSGAITILEANDLVFTGGTAIGSDRNYAKLGHGGGLGAGVGVVDGNHSGAITISSANDLRFTGGLRSLSYAQLGHGGNQSDGNHSGAITITEANDLIFTADDGAHVQLGHGGADTDGDHSGAITILEANDLVFTVGAPTTSDISYAQLGHGGIGADGDHSGAITIGSANDLSFTSGASAFSYAQLGHGGMLGRGSRSGAITISSANDLSFTGGSGAFSYAQLGHGSASFGSSVNQGGGTRMGDILINASGEISTENGASTAVNSNFAWIGHGSADANAISDADVTIFASGWDTSSSVGIADLSAGGVSDLNASIADILSNNLTGGDVTVGLHDSNLTLSSAIIYDEENDFTLMSAGDLNFNESVQNDNAVGGDLNLVAGWDGSAFNLANLQAEDVNSAAILYGLGNGSINIGDGTQTAGIAVGSRSGATNAFSHDLSLLSGDTGSRGFSQLGYRVVDAGGSFEVTGDITVNLKNNLIATGGSRLDSYAQVGHGGGELAGQNPIVEADINASISVSAGNDLIFTAGAGDDSYAHLGHGGLSTLGNHRGDITITEANDLIFTAGSAVNSSVQLGHGGTQAFGSYRGAITLTEVNNLSFTAGAGRGNSYAQLGHGGVTISSFVGVHSGAITITEANDINFTAGAGTRNYTQLGHGGAFTGGGHNGTITIGVANDLHFIAGAGGESYAQLGHGGTFASSSNSGDITIGVANDLRFIGGTGGDSDTQISGDNYAQLGHGGSRSRGDHSGAITIGVVNDLLFTAGGDNNSYAQLGHGGANAVGSHGGAIAIIEANDLIFTGGGLESYSQLGHGGYSAIGSHNGDIMIESVNDLIFTGGSDIRSYAQLGHGGEESRGDYSGDITISSANDLTFTAGVNERASYSQLGHGGVFSDGNYSGDITITEAGDLTFIGGGRFAYSQLGHGSADFGNVGFGSSLQSTGTREGDIFINALGEISTQDGVSSDTNFNFSWIGHTSVTEDAISNADLTIIAASLDRSATNSVASGATGSIRRGIIENAIGGGDVIIMTTDSGLQIDVPTNVIGDGAFTSDNQLLINASDDLVLGTGTTMNNLGAGDIILNAGGNFHNDSGSLTPILTSTGRTLIYSTRPDQNRNDIEITELDFLLYGQAFDPLNPLDTGSLTGDGLIYGVAPVITSTAANQTVTYGTNSPISTTTSVTGTVDGSAIDLAEFGFSTSSTASLIPSLTGIQDAGTYTNAYVSTFSTLTGTNVTNVSGVTLNAVNGSLIVDQLGINITGVFAEDKVYDTSTVATLSGGSLNGVLDSDTVILTNGSGVFATQNVGDGITVTASGYSLSGADAGNYTLLGQPSGLSANITPASLSVSGVSVMDRVFDGTVFATLLGGELVGVLGADDLSLTVGTGVFLDPDVGSSKPVIASGYGVTGAAAGNYILSQPTGLTGNILRENVFTPIDVLPDDHEDYTRALQEFLSKDPPVAAFQWLPDYNEELWELLEQENDLENPLTEEQEVRLREILKSASSTASN